MYLSRVTLATLNPADVEKALGGDSYETHKLCWRLFPEAQKRDFLYRRLPSGFLTLSPSKPVDLEGIWQIESKPFAPRLKVGDQLSFMLTANATVCREGKRHDVMMDAKRAGTDREQAARSWLERRAGSHGFVVTAVDVHAYRQHRFRKQKRMIQFSTIDFVGVLQVQDPTGFVSALRNGIGRAKGFGCGLLLVRRRSH